MFSMNRFIFIGLDHFLSPSTTGKVKVLLIDSGLMFVWKAVVKSLIWADLTLLANFHCSSHTDMMESTWDVSVDKLTFSGVQIF